MHVTYTQDDARRQIEVILDGPFDVDTVIAALERLRAEGVWHYALLADASRTTGAPTIEELNRIRAVDGAGVEGQQPGPLAIVVGDPILFRKACQYAMLVWVDRRVDVFEDRGDAERWLAEAGF